LAMVASRPVNYAVLVLLFFFDQQLEPLRL